MAPREVLGQSDGGPMGRRILLTPVKDESGGDPGVPSFPAIFNIAVDAVIGDMFLDVCGSKKSHH